MRLVCGQAWACRFAHILADEAKKGPLSPEQQKLILSELKLDPPKSKDVDFAKAALDISTRYYHAGLSSDLEYYPGSGTIDDDYEIGEPDTANPAGTLPWAATWDGGCWRAYVRDRTGGSLTFGQKPFGQEDFGFAEIAVVDDFGAPAAVVTQPDLSGGPDAAPTPSFAVLLESPGALFNRYIVITVSSDQETSPEQLVEKERTLASAVYAALPAA